MIISEKTYFQMKDLIIQYENNQSNTQNIDIEHPYLEIVSIIIDKNIILNMLIINYANVDIIIIYILIVMNIWIL